MYNDTGMSLSVPVQRGSSCCRPSAASRDSLKDYSKSATHFATSYHSSLESKKAMQKVKKWDMSSQNRKQLKVTSSRYS